MMMNIKCSKTLIASLSATALLSLSTLTLADFKIGVAGPHSGNSAAFGEQQWNGAQAAADEINARGGINGEKIVLVKADDGCDPQKAVTVAQQMADAEQVNAVVGHFCSSSTLPASEIYNEKGIFMITPASTNPQVTERGLPLVFRIVGRDDQQGMVAGDYLVNTLKAQRIAIVHDNDAYGKGLADATPQRLHALGVNELIYEGIQRGEKDFSQLIAKLEQADVQAVYFGGFVAEAGLLNRQIRESGLDTLFMSGDGIVSEEFVVASGGGKFTQGVVMTFGKDPRTLESGQEVVKAFRNSGIEPEGYVMYSYAAVQAIAEAFNGAQANDSAKAAEYLKANPIATAMGEKAFDEKGDLRVTDYVVYSWKEDGTYSEVKM